jgi:hypothetical protein
MFDSVTERDRTTWMHVTTQRAAESPAIKLMIGQSDLAGIDSASPNGMV